MAKLSPSLTLLRSLAHSARSRHKQMTKLQAILGLTPGKPGDPALKFNARAGPDASRMMLDFFGKHRRPAGARR